MTLTFWLALFATITLAFVAGQTLTLLLFKRDAFKRKPAPQTAKPDEPPAKPRTRGGNWFGGQIRK